MQINYLGAAESGHQKERSHFISPTVSTILTRWNRLRKDPLFVMLSVWAFLFLLAAVIFAET